MLPAVLNMNMQGMTAWQRLPQRACVQLDKIDNYSRVSPPAQQPLEVCRLWKGCASMATSVAWTTLPCQLMWPGAD